MALKISQELLSPENQQEHWIINLLMQSVLIDKILHDRAEDYVLSGDVAEALRNAIMNYNLLSTELRMSFGGDQLWNYTIKQHCLSHIALDCTELSPRPVPEIPIEGARANWVWLFLLEMQCSKCDSRGKTSCSSFSLSLSLSSKGLSH